MIVRARFLLGGDIADGRFKHGQVAAVLLRIGQVNLHPLAHFGFAKGLEGNGVGVVAQEGGDFRRRQLDGDTVFVEADTELSAHIVRGEAEHLARAHARVAP